MIKLQPKAKWVRFNHPLGGDWYTWGDTRVCVAKEDGLWHISISCRNRYPTWDEIYTEMETVTPVPHLNTEQEDKLELIFTHHPPENDEQVEAYKAVREWGLSLAKVICQYTPRGSDQSAAVRKVREAVMTANAAIALKGVSF